MEKSPTWEAMSVQTGFDANNRNPPKDIQKKQEEKARTWASAGCLVTSGGELANCFFRTTATVCPLLSEMKPFSDFSQKSE